ncbi:MAG: basic amino acid ABC transporter substrate-binding protein [Eubacteriales bacterium]
MKKSILLIIILFLSVALLFAGCTSDQDNEQDNGQDEKAVLKVGVDDTYPPMEYRDEDNNLVGFDVELAKAIGEKLDMEVEFISSAWTGIFMALDTSNFDVIISSVSITPKRMESYDFSDPYLANGQVIVVRPDDNSVTKPEDLAGKKVGVQITTTADTAVEKFKETTDITVEKYDEIIQTFNGMKSGYVDYIVVDYPVAIEYVANDPESFKISSVQLTNEPIGICYRKGDTETQDKINGALEELRNDGTLKTLSEEWLGDDYTSNIDEELNAIE